MSSNATTLLKHGCNNLYNSLSPETLKKVEFLNMVNTYIVIIEGKEEYNKVKASLEESGFSDFDLKVEDEMHTLVFQMNGFRFSENMKDSPFDSNVHLIEKKVEVKEEEKKVEVKEEEKKVEVKEEEKKVEVKEEEKKVELEDFIKQIKELELKLMQEKEKNKEMQMSTMIPEPVQVHNSFEIEELKRELETEKIKVKSFIDKQFSLEIENESIKGMLEELDDVKQNNSNLKERNDALKQTIAQLSSEKESVIQQQCEVCLSTNDLKQKFIDRELLSNKIREYVQQDSRVPFLLSMAGLNKSIFEGDVVGNILQI